MSENPFDISHSVRDMAEQNMRQAHTAYEQLTGFVTETMSSWVGAMPSNSVTIGFKEIQDRAMDFAKDNAESAFSFAGKICNAQNAQEILMIQTRFAQDRMQAYTAHTQELCSLIGEAFQKLPRG